MESFDDMSKIAELEYILNKTMLATFKWEQAGEKPYGDKALEAASAIKNHTARAVVLYHELVRLKGTSNLYIKNKSLPPPMPSEIHVQMAIMAIFQFANALESKNPSFKGQLISNDTKNRLTRIIAGDVPAAIGLATDENVLGTEREGNPNTGNPRQYDRYYWFAHLIAIPVIIGGIFGIIYGLKDYMEFMFIVDGQKLGPLFVFLLAVAWGITFLVLFVNHMKKKGY